MTRILLLLVFIDCFLTQLVLSQYSNNDNRGYNQMDNQREEEEEATNDYKRHGFDAYNQQQRSKDYPSEYKETPMPYQFEYNTDDGYGNKQDRHEKADEYGNVVGSYGYMDSNGVYRKVHYTAGPEGFKAKINSNEPFLKHNANPADVMLFVEDPPQNALNSGNYGRQQMNAYPRDEPIDNFDDNDTNQMRDQIYRAAANRVRAQEKRYVNNYDNGFQRMKPFLDMIRPKQGANRNQDYYQPLNSFANHRNRNYNEDIEAYASNRRYYD